MREPEHVQPENAESLRQLLQQRQELDERLETKYQKILTVMFTDIKGSTEYYETRGDIDGRILLEKHNQILLPILEDHKGRIVKSTGDGMLIVFDSPYHGVKAAIAMQRELSEFNKGRKEYERLCVRIAINHGKVIEDEGDIYGLEVSIASRINAVTKANQILISQSVYEELLNVDDIVCRPIPPVKVKGVQAPLRLYQAIWETGSTADGSLEMKADAREIRAGKRMVFVLELTKEAEHIKISGYEKTAGEQKTIRRYDVVKVDDDRINLHVAEIISLLNRANKKGNVRKDILENLKTTGRLLYDEIFSGDIKRKLAETAAEDMIINIDDHLVNVPWELLHDGNTFFGLRFNMGRLVRTRQNISENKTRRVRLPLKMLILSDPQGNLKSAYEEGYGIRDRLEHMENAVHVNIKSSSITSAFVLANIRNYDMVHYTGHADYDKQNPSNSGFLMEDGQLKASDIINLIGPSPLPSLVFSNACKSGHTDAWKIEEDYGREIYGLANAFLLAGVNHYIGTFWDVQDEPGFHFAIDFYQELVNGAMIGEAVRKARLGLIERYGEATVIWASYMLYGDPTFRYIDFSPPENQETEIRDSIEKKDMELMTGDVRSVSGSAVLPLRRHKWIYLGSAFLVILATLLMTLTTFRQRANIGGIATQQNSERREEITKEEKDKRVDELVASLIKAYHEKGKKGQAAVNTRRSSPLTLVFLSINGQGINDADKEYILSKAAGFLQRSNRVQIVEREILDKLIRELKLSSSELSDPATALQIGRILSANIITAGTIARDGKDWQISLRLIETETTAVKAALSETLRTQSKDEIAEKLGSGILARLRAAYPLEGKILSRERDRIALDIGSGNGVTQGLKMEVLAGGLEKQQKVGDIEIVSVEEHQAYGKITSGQESIEKGLIARETL